MICINCGSPKTGVTNSRPHKSKPRVWRRRSCPKCHTIVTTYEYISTADQLQVDTAPFSVARLCLSLYPYLPTDSSADDALELAYTVGDLLASEAKTTVQTVAVTAYEVLARFNKKAGLKYGLDHDCIDPSKLG